MTDWRPDRPAKATERAVLEIDAEPVRRRVQSAWDRAELLAAEGRVGEARALLETAHRRAGADQNLVLALALLRLRDGDAPGASQLFEEVTRRYDVRDAWTGLAAARLLAGDPDAALAACARCLNSHVVYPPLIHALEAALAARPATAPGWCSLSEEGAVLSSLDPEAVSLRLDGQTLPPGTHVLPPGWTKAQHVEMHAGGKALLGSPITVQAIRRVEGFVERTRTGVAGWAWHPACPDTDPPLRVLNGAGQEVLRITATDLGASVDGEQPGARPRKFAFDVAWEGQVRVMDRNGQDLAGSPMGPLPAPHDATPFVRAAAWATSAGPADVVIPIYRGRDATLACIASVLDTVPASTRVWVVDDGSPDAALVGDLHALAREGRLVVLHSSPAGEAPRNVGFPAAANAGLRAAAGRDVVLLNSDTLVAGEWLQTLQSAAHSAADIGTATPFSNEASILSVPDVQGGNPMPDLAGTRRMAALAARANAGRLVEIPTAHGFCMFIRADCLAQTGILREDMFAQGYGEENDFCCRASALGWRQVAVPSVYVAHAGGVSFGPSRKQLMARNQTLLARLHPGYHASVAAHIRADPLFWARRRLDAAVWRERHAHAPGALGSVLLVTHDSGGGTARVVAERAEVLRTAGFRALLLRGQDGDCLLDEPAAGVAAPNLRFTLPGEWPAMLRLIKATRPVAVEFHHMLGHSPALRTLAARLGLPADIWVHDYACLCPRITLIDGDGHYCGEPPPAVCEGCIARAGRADGDAIGVAALRLRSAAEFAAARAVFVPSDEVATRLRRHFPACSPQLARWPGAADFAPLSTAAVRAPVRVVIAGAIGIEKGFSVIAACAADSAARDLNLFFTVIGYTIDDDALEATGRVMISGPYEASEVKALIEGVDAHLAFIPSIWPETWCFALTEVWDAGLPACVFDIGTQAQRVRQNGRGWVIPLGLPPPRVNDALLALAGGAMEALPRHSPRGTIRPRPPGESAR